MKISFLKFLDAMQLTIFCCLTLSGTQGVSRLNFFFSLGVCNCSILVVSIVVTEPCMFIIVQKSVYGLCWLWVIVPHCQCLRWYERGEDGESMLGAAAYGLIVARVG